MNKEEELKKEIAIFPSKTLHQYDSGKLLWKGTIKEAIEKGKVTQEEVDKWNMEDEIGEDYMEGFQAGQLAERQRCLKVIEECFEKINVRTASGKQRMPICVLVELKQELNSKINEGDK